ncbi:MAG: TIGR00159 family protein [Gemmatimonadetes bacterium]|nr:TIGR00159 family protein [Gemmatimonadota bacterium]
MNAFADQIAFLRPGWTDLIEILIVAFLFYRLLLLLQRTRAMQMLLGLLLLAGTYFGARILGFELIRYLLENLFQYGAIAALVVFQPELRAALARLGQSRMMRLFTRRQESEVVDEVVEAVDQLSRSNIGAIIAIEREIALDEYAQTGSPLNARVSSEMLLTIFTPYSPLHDGAVIISGNVVKAAGVILPLTQFPVHDKTLGTRHRAALGLSEETDALVVVVSEETSRVSVAQRGRLDAGVEPQRLREILAGTFEGRSGVVRRPAPVG